MGKKAIRNMVFALTLSFLCCAQAIGAAARPEPAPDAAGFILLMEGDAFSYFVWQPPVGDKDEGEIWVKIAVKSLGRSLLATQRSDAGLTVGKYRNVECILCRVQLPSQESGRNLLVWEQIYYDKDGRAIAHWTAWQQRPAEPSIRFVDRECTEFLYRYLSFSSSSYVEYTDGFCDIAWGTPPEEVKGARLVSSVAGNGMADYEAYVDSSRMLGNIPAAVPQKLTFSSSRGLVIGSILFEDRYYAAVVDRLNARLGAAYSASGGVLRWFVGQDTVIDVSPVLKEGLRKLTAVEYRWWRDQQE